MAAKILAIPENLESGWASAKLVEPKEVQEMTIQKIKKTISIRIKAQNT